MIDTSYTAFLLLSSALVFIMVPGLAFFYGGLVRRHNVLTIMMQNIIAMGLVTLIWFALTFSLAFGGDWNGLLGNLDYLLMSNVDLNAVLPGMAVPLWAFFLFQMMFAIITPALITGAFVDRMKFSAFLLFLGLWSILVYAPVAHWIWGGGILAKLGAIDFAGGTAVHINAGMAALAAILFLGKRKNGQETRPHNVPYVVLGASLLWFGWFGFNGGSALTAGSLATIAFVNTDLAASAAMVIWLFLSWWHKGKPSLVGALTGAVAGLVAVTPAAGFVAPWAALLIGVIAGAVCYWAIILKNKMNWDDALDVWAVHGVGGITGSILTGLLASPAINSSVGWFYGNFALFKANLIAVIIVALYSFIMTYLILKLMSLFGEIRVDEESEKNGLDKILHGEEAYDF